MKKFEYRRQSFNLRFLLSAYRFLLTDTSSALARGLGL